MRLVALILSALLAFSSAFASPQTQPLDMQTFQINNLGAATSGSDAARFDQIPTPYPTTTPVATFTPISGTGILAQTAANTFATRTITGTSGEILIGNGGGVAAAPNIGLASAITDTLHTGWNPFAVGALSYSSANVIASSVDYTGILNVGDKIWITQSGSKWFYVTSVSSSQIGVYAGSDYTVANSIISGPYYSHDATPTGFPHWFNYSPTVTGFSANPTGTVYQFAIVGQTAIVTVSQTSPGTSNATTFTISGPIACRAGSNAYVNAPFATNNGSAIATAVVQATSGTSTLTISKDAVGGTWTNANGKAVNFTITYPI